MAALAHLEQAEATDLRAKDDFHRYRLLVEKREVAEQVYDQALAAARSSTAAVAAARANESAAQQFVQQARSRLEQAVANHESAGTGPPQGSATRARGRAPIPGMETRRRPLRQALVNPH